jgi:small conductance mechanosensitive channel
MRNPIRPTRPLLRRAAPSLLACLLACAGAGASPLPANAPPDALPDPAAEALSPAVADGAPLAARMHDIRGLAGVRVRQYGGVVFLEGRVAAEADRELAGKIAAGAEGVRDVVNDLEVHSTLGERLREAGSDSLRRLERFVGTAPLLLVAVLVVWLAWWLSSWLADHRWLARSWRGNAFVSQLLRHAIRIGGLLVGLIIALRLLDAVALAGALLGSAGVLGIALGFAFKDLVENYIASILLSLRQPFRPNDHVVIDGNEGVVVGLSSRVTVLMTPAGNHLSLPNAMVFKSVLMNYSRNPKRRFDFVLALGPETSSTLVLEQGLAELAGIDGVLSEPAPSVSVQRASRDGIDFQFNAWVDQRRTNIGWARSTAIRRVRSRLRSHGVAFDGPVLHVTAGSAAAVEVEPAVGGQHSPSETDVLRQAVEQTRAEMADSDLLQPQRSDR